MKGSLIHAHRRGREHFGLSSITSAFDFFISYKIILCDIEVQGGHMASVMEYGLPTAHAYCMDCHLSYLTSCGHSRLELSALHISQN
jgi:hypothetical protein